MYIYQYSRETHRTNPQSFIAIYWHLGCIGHEVSFENLRQIFWLYNSPTVQIETANSFTILAKPLNFSIAFVIYDI